MSPRERVLATLRGEVADRPPFAVWRHFFGQEDAGAEALAGTLVAFVRHHALDLLKYNSRAHYHAEPWGTRYRYREDERPTLVRCAVERASDWERIRPVPPTEGVFAEMLEGLRIARAELPAVPLLMTIFTPLAVCERLGGRERLLADLRAEPERVQVALEAVTETFGAFAAACLALGAEGIFFATTAWAQRDTVTDAEYARFGRPFDLRVLARAAGAELNVLHVCGAKARVVELADYPVAAVSWNVHAGGNPSLAEFRARVPGRVAIGGVSDAALLSADTGAVRAEVHAALAQTDGRQWIAAGGCTIPPDSNTAAIDVARAALEPAPTR